MNELLPYLMMGHSLVKNASGEVIYPGSCLRIISETLVGTHICYSVGKPNGSATTFLRDYLVSGPITIGSTSSSYGIARSLSEGGFARYRTGAGTPAVGEVWGPKHDQWELEKDYYGFIIRGGNTTFTGSGAVTVARQIDVPMVLGKITDSSVALNGTCTVQVWNGTGSDNTNMEITGVVNRIQALNAISLPFCGVGWMAGTPVLLWTKRTLTNKTFVGNFRENGGGTAIEADTFTAYVEDVDNANTTNKVTISSC